MVVVREIIIQNVSFEIRIPGCRVNTYFHNSPIDTTHQLHQWETSRHVR